MAKETLSRVAVVGGGMTGLSAALRLAQARGDGENVEEYLFEASSRLGGVVRSEEVDGCIVEAGPDSFLSEKPQAAELAYELGIGDDIVGSNDSERVTYILHRGRMVPLPDGLMFLVPTKLVPMAVTPLIPLSDKVQMLSEWFFRPRKVEDESVASFVSRHFGRAMVDNIADPLLSGVYGGDADELSIRATLPRFAELEEKYGSLIRGVLEARKRMRRAPASSRPLFSTLKSGLSHMVRAIESRLASERVRCKTVVSGVRVGNAGPRRTYELRAEGQSLGSFDGLVLALPAHQSGRLLSGIDAVMAQPLLDFPYSSSMTVVLGFPAEVRQMLPPGFGFLAPRNEGLRMLACTFVHAKFPARVPPDRAILRCFLGGSRDPGILEVSDEEITRLVRNELRYILGLQADPTFVRIYRWRRAMAQYSVGHGKRVAAVKAGAGRNPGLFLAGNWESGIGISDCIRTGAAAALNCIRYLKANSASQP